MNIKRYAQSFDDDGAIEESDNGNYVLYSDYEALKKRVEIYIEALKQCQKGIDEAFKTQHGSQVGCWTELEIAETMIKAALNEKPE